MMMIMIMLSMICDDDAIENGDDSGGDDNHDVMQNVPIITSLYYIYVCMYECCITLIIASNPMHTIQLTTLYIL